MKSNVSDSRKKRIGRLLNIAIVVMFLAVAGMLAGRSLSSPPEPPTLAPTAQIFIEGIDWTKSEQTLLIAIRNGCEYCAKSARFYRRLIYELKGRADVQVVVVYPDETPRAEAYLRDIGLTAIESKQEVLARLGIKLVPTLALVDGNGVVRKVWVGELSPKKESEVMSALQLKDTRPVSEWIMSENELKRRVENREAVVILDLRERDAYINEHLGGAKNIPSDEIYTRAKNELPDNQTIVLYDNDEIRADIAYSDLFKLGYTNVFIYSANSANQ